MSVVNEVSRSQTSRRALVRGAAWSVPVVAAAAAAPAYAASCGDLSNYTLAWGTTPYNRTSMSLGTATVQAGAGSQTGALPVTVEFRSSWTSGTDRRSATGNLAVSNVTNVNGTGKNWAMALSHTSSTSNTAERQSVVITFSRPVTSLSFTIIDIDSNTLLGSGWSDQVSLSGSRDFTFANPNWLTGTGTSADPWRTINFPADVGPTDPNGNVTVNFTAPTTSVTWQFWSTVANRNQTIGVTDFSFKAASC